MPASSKRRKTFIIILLTGLFAGTADAVAAILWNHKSPPAIIFDFIASAVFGRAAFSGGAQMVLWGLLFHYIIAIGFTAAWYLLYPWFYRILGNKFVVAFVYGLLTWVVMNIVVVPLSKIGFKPFLQVWPIVIGMTILIICIGLPAAIMADRQRKRQQLLHAPE